MLDFYDIIVVGGGHAGSEAAHAAAILGKRTLLLCFNKKMIANMPCNPHIGGSAKGIVVREIDALGGIMGKIADQNYLQIKLLNTSKGPGVQSLRTQEDKISYPRGIQECLYNTPNLDVEEHEVKEIVTNVDNTIKGIKIEDGRMIRAKAVILTTGTHLEAQIFRGTDVKDEGPDGEPSSHGLSKSLEDHGIELFRLKTGTPQRIDPDTVDVNKLLPQYGSSKKLAFSYDTTTYVPLEKQWPCYLCYTNLNTHKIIRDNLDKCSMYGGLINGKGPRYCPSIETKLVAFKDKSRHQLFFEPESKELSTWYLQGLSTSMPVELQEDMVHSLLGFEHAKIVKYAYAIEYDAIKPLQLDKKLMIRKVPGLFGAGQIIGTSGYEEAASLGLMAAINASLYLDKKHPFILRREEAYIGVMIDDLVTKGTDEPYRLLSSRSEYRLLTRSDNADTRLMKYGFELGLNSKERYDILVAKDKIISDTTETIKKIHLGQNNSVSRYIVSLGFPEPDPSVSYYDLIKRQPVKYANCTEYDARLPVLPDELTNKMEINIKYEGYIRIQIKEANKLKSYEDYPIPNGMDYLNMDGLSLEAREKMKKIQPKTIGVASRITNVHPADINVLLLHIKKFNRKK